MKNFILLFVCLSCSFLSLPAQEVYAEFENPSFEIGLGNHLWGPRELAMRWRRLCYTGLWNTPNWFPERDKGHSVEPKHGDRYVGMVTRYLADPGYSWSYESISSPVNNVELEPGEYFFWVWLAWHDSTYYDTLVQGFIDDYGHLPAKLKVYLGPALPRLFTGYYAFPPHFRDFLHPSDACGPEMKEIFLSPPITHHDWRPYLISFKVEEAGSYVFRLESHMAPEVDTALIGGHVLVDHLSPIFRGKPPHLTGNYQAFCAGDTLALTVDTSDMSAVAIEWDDGSQGPVRKVWQPGFYWYELRSTQYEFSYRDTVRVRETEMPPLMVGGDTLLCEGETLTVDLSDFPTRFQVDWNGQPSGRTFTITQPGDYRVAVYDEYCYQEETIRARYQGCRMWLDMPNVFTPNGDGQNDGFGPMRYENLITYELKVYDRWGRLLWRGTHPADTWAGNYQGRPVAVGTYFWQCRYANQRGETEQQRGSLTLLR